MAPRMMLTRTALTLAVASVSLAACGGEATPGASASSAASSAATTSAPAGAASDAVTSTLTSPGGGTTATTSTAATTTTTTTTATSATTSAAASSTGAATASSTSPRPAAPTKATGAGLAASYDQLRQGLSGRTGIALVPVGGGRAITAGPEQTDHAWSTIKVAITIAALDEGATERKTRLARQAITVSDNAAAKSLWLTLGGGRTSARKVDSVLREGGDTKTSVASVAGSGPSAFFGMTPWALTDAATFASGLPCMKRAAPVLGLMREVDPSQHWGLGRIPGSAFKGGWGPEDRGFLTRQLGVVTKKDGSQYGIALVSVASAGMDAGTRDLDRIAAWLRQHEAEIPSGRCR